MFALSRLFPAKPELNFMKLRVPATLCAIAVICASVFFFFDRGLNFGIDFAGGVLIEIRTQSPASLSELRSTLDDIIPDGITIQNFGSDYDVLIRVKAQENSQQAAALVSLIKDTLPESVEYRRVEFVGPNVGEDLVESGVISVVAILSVIMIYIWLRFEWQFGLGAVVALLHDVITTIGFFALTGLEFNLTTVAAILTIAGYSINDTVVVYDRIRANIYKYNKSNLETIINRSLSEVLARTLLTSISTLVALFALYFIGGAATAGFTLALIWGVIIGTFSSIYIAAPFLIYLGLRQDLMLEFKNASSSD